MNLTCDYNALVGYLTSVSTVVEDSLSTEDMRNIIFRINKNGGVELIGINQMITYRIQMDVSEFTIKAEDEEYNADGVYFMQVKSKEILGYLNTFKTIRRTKVKDVALEVVKNKVQLTTIEENLETGAELSSQWTFDNIPIKANLLPLINLTMPTEGVAAEDTTGILLYTSCLLPLMQNGTNLYSRLIFGEDKVVAFNAAFVTLMNNTLGEAFKKIALTYRGIAFMRNVICNTPVVNVAKTEQYLCFTAENFEAFIRYDSRLSDYSIYEKMFVKDHAFVLDRQYFKDVLKRLSLVNDAVEVHIPVEGGAITVKNSKFSQDIPILQEKNLSALGGISFKILPEVLTKAIIGDDSQFSETVFVYISQAANGAYTLVFADDSGYWFTVASIR